MTFVVTSQGDELSLEAPSRSHITAFDIAWSLAQTNRFSGRCIRPYSVAEHSLLVCEIAERELGLNVHGLMLAVMHDAHEAYTGDMHTPGKHASAWAGKTGATGGSTATTSWTSRATNWRFPTATARAASQRWRRRSE